jgi:hypothetical protein
VPFQAPLFHEPAPLTPDAAPPPPAPPPRPPTSGRVVIEDEVDGVGVADGVDGTARGTAERFQPLLGSWSAARCIDIMKHIQQTHVFVEKSIPKDCRARAQRIFVQLEEACHTLPEDLRPHALLFHFPRIFACPKRGGKDHNKLRHYMHRLDLAEAGRWDELLAQTPASERRIVEQDELKRAEALVRDGDVSRAARLLTSFGVAPNNEATFKKLQEKHPEGRPIETPPGMPPPVRVNTKHVEEALKSFKKGTASGPSGARADLYKWLIQGADGKSVLKAITSFTNGMLAGSFPTKTVPFWAGAVLVALRKDKEGSDVRPIAVGEVMRRLAGKAALLAIGSRARDILLPFQVAVNVQAGAEGIVRAARLYLGAHFNQIDRAELSVDIKNAFNTIDRAHVLRSVSEKLPGLAAFAYWCYATPSHLIYGPSILLSSAGVQQGDPLGTLLFCLGIDQTLRTVKDAHPDLDILAFYADDGTLAAPSDTLIAAFLRLTRELAEINLVVNTKKCYLLPTFRPSNYKDTEAKTTKVSEAASDAVGRLAEALPDVRIAWGLPLLGTVVSHMAAFDRAHLGEEARATAALMDRILDLDDAQIAYILLRHCGPTARSMFTARISSSFSSPSASAFFSLMDRMTRTTIEGILGFGLADGQWTSAQLRVDDAGLALRSLSEHQEAAWLGSYWQTRDLVNLIYPAAPEDTSLSSIITKFNARVEEQDRLDAAHPTPTSQHILSENVYKKQAKDYKATLRDDASRTRLQAKSAPHANAWLNVMDPNERDGTAFTTAEWIAAVKDHLDIDGRDGLTHCPLAHHKGGQRVQIALEHNTTHHKGCGVGHGTRDRSLMIEKTLGKLESLAGRRVEYQPRGLLPAVQDGLTRPDLLVVAPEGTRTAIDVSVTSSVQMNLLSRSAARVGLAAQTIENAKVAHYRPLPDGLRFQPIVAETYGTWGIKSMAYLKSLVTAIAVRLQAPRPWAAAQVFNRLSCALQRGNARMILERQRPL